MSQMRKFLFASAILGGHCLFPRCLLNPTAIQTTALSEEGLRFSRDGCYVGMDSDALDGSVVLEVSYLCPAMNNPSPQDLRCKVLTSSSPHLNFVRRPALGQVQDSPEVSFQEQNPASW